MEPIKFEQANVELQRPPSMTEEECQPLWIYRGGGQCISCWEPTVWERIKLVFHGKIWLSVYSGNTQPPVWVSAQATVFKKED